MIKKIILIIVISCPLFLSCSKDKSIIDLPVDKKSFTYQLMYGALLHYGYSEQDSHVGAEAYTIVNFIECDIDKKRQNNIEYQNKTGSEIFFSEDNPR